MYTNARMFTQKARPKFQHNQSVNIRWYHSLTTINQAQNFKIRNLYLGSTPMHCLGRVGKYLPSKCPSKLPWEFKLSQKCGKLYYILSWCPITKIYHEAT